MPHMFIPGPVDVNPLILAAQTRPMLPHRSEEFEKIFQHVEEMARLIFYTRGRVFIFASSGTGLQEAAVRNFARQKLLSCVNGAFGERWHQVALSNGKAADRLDVPWDQPLTPELVVEALGRKRYEAITLVHNETSTGLQNPVREIASAVRQSSPETLICVDAVSSLGGVKISTDAWGLDMVLTSSQKCLALPPGLGLAAVSDRAIAYAQSVLDRGWYFDLLRMERHRQSDSTPATPAISLVYAMEAQLGRIIEEGLENRYARHRAMAERVQSWATSRGLGLYAPHGYRSNTVTAVRKEPDLEVGEINKFLLERGMRIAGGYGPLKKTTLRIAHMGETNLEDIDGLLTALDEFLAR